MIVRDAQAGDLPDIQAIVNYYRLHTACLWDRTPLDMRQMEAWLDEHTRTPYTALVAEEEGEILGYASLSCFRPYAGYAPTAEDSIYLAPGQTNKGCGGVLMRELLCRARSNGLSVVTAWIDSENTASLGFHEKFGFVYVGVMRGVGVLDGLRRSVVILQAELT